jgi:DNA-binding NarL/FixJ family response regulator
MNKNLCDFRLNDKIGKQLTEREYEVLKGVVMGKSNSEIAKELNISVHTAKAHVCSILQKLAVEHRVQAAVKAVRQDLV